MSRFCQRTLLFAFAFLVALTAESASLEELFEQPEVKQIKISPTGDYLAIRVFGNGVHTLVFIDRESRGVLGGLKFSGSDEVGNFYWANDERVVAQVFDVGGSQEAPRNYGELYAVNFDGKNAIPIFGYRSGEMQTGSIIRRRTSEHAWGEMIDPFPANKRQILISSTAMSESQAGHPVAMMLDVYTGMEKGQVHVAEYPGARFLTDSLGVIRLVTSRDDDNNAHVQGLPAGAREWIEFPGASYGSHFRPIAISDDRKSAYVLDNVQGDKIGLYKMSLDGKEYKQIYANEDVDITDVNMSSDGRSVYAMRVDKDYPSYLVMSSDHEEAKIFKDLLLTFPGRTVDISSRSDDGRFWVIHTSSDVDAGSFYLFDRDENSLRLIFKSLPKINSDDLSTVEPIEFDSSDGRRITGYFTRAKTDDDAVPPLVVLVHGGPRARDYWQFDPEVQALATRGFSVLQVNYRGSTGFGDNFTRAGDLHWGDLIQQDIISGTRWAVANGRAREGAICIMGTSFGAYSAVQSAILEPDLFACAVANAGIYDLELLYKRGDIEERYWGDAYLEEVVGRDKDQLREFSPVHSVAALKAPLLVAHGKKDERAPFEHAKRLRRELDKHDIQYEWFVKRREAHGFYDTQNRVEYIEEVLAFLKKHVHR